MIRACIFDAFGTLFNLDKTLVKNVDHPSVHDILDYARSKQLSYTWLKSLMQDYTPFDEITKSVLRDACAKYNAPQVLVDQLAKLYFEPVIFEDVLPGLQLLRTYDITIGILSNGTSEMLKSGIMKNHLDEFIDKIYSVNEIEIFKPDPRVYGMVTNDLSINQEEVLFVSSNQWDVAGAAKYGFQVAWLNRLHVFRESIIPRSNVTKISALRGILKLL